MIPILIGAFLFVILVFWVDPRATDRTLFYVLPLTMIAALGVYANNYSRQKWMFGATIIGFFCVVAVFLFLTLYLANSTPILSYIRKVSMFTIPLLIILGVAALYPMIQVWASHQNGLVQGILNLILFLPCAVRDMFDFIVHEFHITTSTTRVILLVQLGLFLLYFGGPALYNKIAQWGGDSYLYKDTFLFGRTTPNRIIIRDKSYFQKHPLTNYTVSFWVFQNGTRLENKFHSVLNYGERPHVRVL